MKTPIDGRGLMAAERSVLIGSLVPLPCGLGSAQSEFNFACDLNHRSVDKNGWRQSGVPSHTGWIDRREIP
jgi:hypothetical protein